MKYTFPRILAASVLIALSTSDLEAKASVIQKTLPNGRIVTVEAVTDNIIKVTNAVQGTSPLPTLTALSATETANATISSAGNYDFITTATNVVVMVNSESGEVVINAGAGKVVTDPGLRPLKDGNQVLSLSTTASGSYYGTGERGHKLNLRGDTLVMYNRQNYGYTKQDPRISQMNITMPLFLSTDGFALLFDDFAASTLFLDKGAKIEYVTENAHPVSYYFINGASTLADVTTELSSLTGRQPLPPLWGLGYITSKYGYHDERETRGVVDTLKRAGYPLDGIVLDLYWYGKEQDMGRLEWEPSQWSNPSKMLSDLKKKGVNLVAISQPYVLRNGKALDNYNLLSEKGMFVADSTGSAPQEVTIWVGEGGMFDVANPQTRQWLSDRYKLLTDMGITGWWGDLGEPEVHPETALHANGLTARQYHNRYGNDWSQIISDLFEKEYPDTRLLTMMRGGTIGLQRYSVFPWSTDVSRSWGGLQPQVTIMLNSGLSGLGYMGHDVGGFAVDQSHPEDAELYVRWLQLGAFSPMLRTHAQFKAEPYHYPQYESIIKQLILDRYRWLPYNYTLAYENASKGWPLVRPLNFHEAGTKSRYDDITDEYLWGSELLVAPVMQQGAVERTVTFPEGTWIDFAEPKKKYDGGSTIVYPAQLEVLPLFVKAGAFIPMAEYKMNSTADYRADRFTVNYYPAAGIESTYALYDDNRLSPKALESNEYRLIHFKGTTDIDGNSKIVVTSEGTYPTAPEKVSLTFKIQGCEPLSASATAKIKKTAENTFSVTYVPGTTLEISFTK